MHQESDLCDHLQVSPDMQVLTAREKQIIREIIQGSSNPEIATELFFSVNTVKFHVANILHKLQVRSRVDVAVMAARHTAGIEIAHISEPEHRARG